jgi:hypothetical protein
VVAAHLAFLLSNVTWWGCVMTLLCFVGFAVELARGTAAHRPV